MTPTRFALLVLAAIAVVLAVGCDAFVEQVQPLPNPSPVPHPVVMIDAAGCVRTYASGLATVFEKSATQFEQHLASELIADEMGDGQKAARLQAFTPLMQRLNELRPRPDATDEQRAEADVERARVLRGWANQLRGISSKERPE